MPRTCTGARSTVLWRSQGLGYLGRPARSSRRPSSSSPTLVEDLPSVLAEDYANFSESQKSVLADRVALIRGSGDPPADPQSPDPRPAGLKPLLLVPCTLTGTARRTSTPTARLWSGSTRAGSRSQTTTRPTTSARPPGSWSRSPRTATTPTCRLDRPSRKVPRSNWTYDVTNTGNTRLTNVTLTDDKVGSITCPETELGRLESMTCTATGTATWASTRTQRPPPAWTSSSGSSPTPTPRTTSATCPASSPEVHQRRGRRRPDGSVHPGWRLGPLELRADEHRKHRHSQLHHQGLRPIVACPLVQRLAPGAYVTCLATGTARAGQYANTATAEALDELGRSSRPAIPRTTSAASRP